MKKHSSAAVAAVRRDWMRKSSFKVIKEEDNGFMRLCTPDGAHIVDVWLTTGTWNEVGKPPRLNDWNGFLEWTMVVL